MVGRWRAWLDRLQGPGYSRKQPLILLNGLAEQSESWYCNHLYWRRFFDVHMPNILVYEGEALHQHLAAGKTIDVDYLVEQLHRYLQTFVQTPPYHLVASSLGGKVAVEYAARYPERVHRLVLLCPSGMGDVERLPLMEGVRHNNLRTLVESVFHDPGRVDPGLLEYYQSRFAIRRWRTGLLRTIRGTTGHCVRERLTQLTQPTLLVVGREDRVVDPAHAELAAHSLAQGYFLAIPRCGHAPQLEKPRLVNRLVVRFLAGPLPAREPLWPQFISAAAV